MSEIARGIVPAGKRLLPLLLLIAASAPLAARADNAIVDVRTLPRLEGAFEDTSRAQSHNLSYVVPTAVPVTTAAIKKLLAADGWVQFLRPLDEKSSSITFKKAQQGLLVSFTQGPGRPDQSVVNYISERISANVPFPPDAADVVFDQHRPYLGCVAPLALEATLDFFRTEMAAIGWKQLTAADVAARWPGAEFNEMVENGVRAYYSHADGDGFYRQRPVMLTLQRRGDGRTGVEIRVAPFALQGLEADSEMAGLPRPKPTKTAKSLGGSNSDRRQLDVAVIAELPATLAFYRRELSSRNWLEETAGATVTPDNVTLNFSSPEQTATLKLSRKYDLTLVSLTTQMKEAALAARARAKKEADEKFMKDAADMAKQVIAADEARRVAQAANLSDAPLRALADSTTPVPLPENAENVKFDGAGGRLEFNSASSVRTVAAFYRGSLTAQGWKEKPSIINQPNMAVMEFSKGRKTLSLTAMQMGPRVRVSADGSALVMANAPESAKTSGASAGKTIAEALEPDPDSALPVPKQRTMTSIGTGKMPGSDAPLRRELEASIPAELNSVLVFYRSELGKRGWQETTEGAITKPDQVRLAFTSPDGPATLKLGRRNGEPMVNLAQKYPAAAAKADVVPKPGQSKLMFGNVGKSDATISINKQTIKVAAGAGGPQPSRPPMIDLPPGKYQYALKIAGGPARNNQIEIGAGDTWGVMIGPGGDVLPLQMY
ncbi:hypothetical protein J6524_33915 [Bradyrhizobium sp. WSM 1738]|uniref:hypothetical protein n=1 Tax=Bradyrhizobium hereditatis TaxID=2821405 RepID=UPI001CE2379F|nr:hypothetical protein [Bradyrhizobium hereditatis]MCA6119836.1 hypothetical protein [Bradyrhizobium hereditatis]